MATAAYKNTNPYTPNYQVPSNKGGLLPANPLKFCLKYDPPLIAIVYTLNQKNREKKYVHEIRVDIKENSDIGKICDELCTREYVYLNPQKISKQQVRDLLTNLQNHIIK